MHCSSRVLGSFLSSEVQRHLVLEQFEPLWRKIETKMVDVSSQVYKIEIDHVGHSGKDSNDISSVFEAFRINKEG